MSVYDDKGQLLDYRTICEHEKVNYSIRGRFANMNEMRTGFRFQFATKRRRASPVVLETMYPSWLPEWEWNVYRWTSMADDFRPLDSTGAEVFGLSKEEGYKVES